MEQRLRITVILPNDGPTEADAFTEIVVHLSERVFPREGYTLFKRVEGYWFSPEVDDWVRDYSTHFVTDISRAWEPDEGFEQSLENVRLFAKTAYRNAGCPQEEIWITSHPVDYLGRSRE